MQTRIATTTAVEGLGYDFQRHLFEVVSGQYRGRLVALIQTSPSEIKMTWSDNRGLAWCTPQMIVTDAADGTCDCAITSEGHLQLVYTKQSTGYLVTRRLAFSGGGWSTGSEVTIYGGASYDPTVAVAPDGALWVSWAIYSSPNRTVHAKSSSDNGATWGSGPSDSGVQLFGPAMFLWSRVVADTNSVHVFGVDQNTGIGIRSRALSGGEWSSAFSIASGTGFSRNFDIAVGGDGRLGVVFDRGGLYYREYDGYVWGAIANPDSAGGSRPQLLFQGNVPAIVYLRTFCGSEMIALYTDRKTGAFAEPRPMDSRAKAFDSVILYHAASQSYGDLTLAAASLSTGDILHPQSAGLVAGSGDIVYLGMDQPFRFARVNLATPGSGGTLAYSYWDGANWRSFTPESGLNHLNTAWVDLLFWPDYSSLPADWQRCSIHGASRFWVRLLCTSAYATCPVGSQLTAISRLGRLAFRR